MLSILVYIAIYQALIQLDLSILWCYYYLSQF
jgi:hypothetical protein